jgi:D-arabinose 5-phosphate isomerase GutQ
MVDHSDYIIAVYKDGESGGTRNTINYAESKNKKIIIIPPE